MSERFGIPDHAPQHAPDRAQQNPTPQGSWGGHDAGAADAGWPTSPASGGGSGGTGYYAATPFVPRPKSVKAAIVLEMIFGPLGLFYVSFLNGVAALSWWCRSRARSRLSSSPRSAGASSPSRPSYPSCGASPCRGRSSAYGGATESSMCRSD